MDKEQLTRVEPDETTEEVQQIQIEPIHDGTETSPTEWDGAEYSPCERCADYLSEITSYISGDNTPLTTAGWIWVNLAMLIPPLNLILLFLWAGGGTRRTNLKNYARGILLTAVVLTLVFLITVVIAEYGFGYEINIVGKMG